MRKIFVLAVISIVVISSCAFGAQRRGVRVSSEGREIPSDPMLPVYDNPKEIDLLKDKLHISFKGAFRGIDDLGKLTDWVYFAFTVKGEKDKYLAVGQSELFDSKGNSYKYHAVPKIGSEHVFGRDIAAEITVPVLVGVNMPIRDAGEFPTVSNITITFNKRAFQYRNIVVENWEILDELEQELGL